MAERKSGSKSRSSSRKGSSSGRQGAKGKLEDQADEHGDEGAMSKGEESQTGGKDMGRPPADEPDVFVDIPEIHVGELQVDVQRLEAHLALRAQIANLLNLVAGVHVSVDEVKIDLKEIDAQAVLKVRLENTYNILDRTLTTLDENPEIVQGLLDTADSAVQETGEIGKGATQPGGAVSELGSGLSGTLSGVGDGLSNVADKANPKRLLSSGNGSGSSGASSNGGAGRRAVKVGLIGLASAAGIAGGMIAGDGRLRRSPLKKAVKKLTP